MLSTLARRGLAGPAAGGRSLSATPAAARALPALTNEAAPAAPSWLSFLFGGSVSRSVPLTDPLPGVEEPAPFQAPVAPPATESSTLSNGVKIASEATLGATATLGIYVNAGSVNESPEQTGLSHLLEYMAFKSTDHRTHFRLVREVEAIGGNLIASASREQMAYNVDVVKSNVPEALEILADSVLNPKFNAWEVKEQVKRLEADVKGLKDNPQAMVLESLHEVAYTGALARPLFCPEGAIGGLSAEKLADFVKENYTGPRVVLAAAGVPHSELESLAKPLFESLPAGPAPPQPVSKYVGGDYRQYSATPLTHTMLGFEFAGGWRDLKGSVAITALGFLLGGGGSFSAGGPGKGMHSRLYTRVLNKHAWVQSCSSFSSLYNDTGLVGIAASVESSKANSILDILTEELQALTKDVPSEELERAKNAAVSSILMNLESRAVVAEDIGRQIVTYGHRKPVDEFLAALRALKPSDITSVAGKMYKTPPCMATIGDITAVPRYDDVASRFR